MSIFDNIYQYYINKDINDINEAYESPLDSSGISYEKGLKGEEYFPKVLKFNGYLWEPASDKEDYTKHIDGYIESPYTQNIYSVEVKGDKNNCGNNTILLELRSRGGINVRGWLYGHAEYIAFFHNNPEEKFPYHKDMFILINRQKLVDLAEQKTNTHWEMLSGKDTFVYDPDNMVDNGCKAVAPKLYTRQVGDSISIITRISLIDILQNLKKNEDYFVMKRIEKKNRNIIVQQAKQHNLNIDYNSYKNQKL